MRCEEVRAAYLAGEAGPEAAAHLQTCAACRSEQPALGELRSALADRALWEEPPPELWSPVVQAVTTRAGPSPARRRRRWVGALAAALVLVAGVGAWARMEARRPSPPDWEVTLVGTELAPRARGVVRGWELASGTALYLRIEGLERAPDGYYYELWFAGERGVVSAGTFWEPTGFGLWAAARLADYPQLGVTLEPDDGDPSRKGEKVLGSIAER